MTKALKTKMDKDKARKEKARKAKARKAAPKAKTSELLEKAYLNEVEVSQITGKAIATLRNERHLRRGIPYLKVGARSIRYRPQDVKNYMECQC